ncbi:hypothetical protein D3C76_1752760 [compost metagenome]
MVGTDKKRELRDSSASGQYIRQAFSLIKTALDETGFRDRYRDKQIGLPRCGCTELTIALMIFNIIFQLYISTIQHHTQ